MRNKKSRLGIITLTEMVVIAVVLVVFVFAYLLHINTKKQAALQTNKAVSGATGRFSIVVDGERRVVTAQDLFVVTSDSPNIVSRFKVGNVYRLKRLVGNNFVNTDGWSESLSYCFESVLADEQLCLTNSELEIEQTFVTFQILKTSSPEYNRALEALNDRW